jgi:hypothetical protein
MSGEAKRDKPGGLVDRGGMPVSTLARAWVCHGRQPPL